MSDNDLWPVIRDRDAENARMRCEIERLRRALFEAAERLTARGHHFGAERAMAAYEGEK